MEYVVFMTDLALAPLEGQNPRGSKLVELATVADAKELAESEKEDWHRVIIYHREKAGVLREVGSFHKVPGENSPARYYEARQ